MGRMTLITGAERRRRWGKEDRARILAAIEEPGAVVAEVARAADVCTSLVYKWRREARSAAPKNDVSGFASVVVEAPMAAPPSLPSTTNSEPGVIVVDMRDARVSDRRRRADCGDRSDVEGVAAVIPIPPGRRVWIATGYTDMRRGMQGLALQVQEQLKRDPHAGDLYIFRGRRGDLAKILWHDGVGLSLYANYLASYCTSSDSMKGL